MTELRAPRPGEVPLEVVDKDINPEFYESGRGTLSFPTRPDGRRIEWVTIEIAKKYTQHPYNRDGGAMIFDVAKDLMHEVEDSAFDKRVLSTLRRHFGVGVIERLKALADPLQVTNYQATTPDPSPAPEPDPEPTPFAAGIESEDELPDIPLEADVPFEEVPESDISLLGKAELVALAEKRGIDIDGRWSVTRILEKMQA